MAGVIYVSGPQLFGGLQLLPQARGAGTAPVPCAAPGVRLPQISVNRSHAVAYVVGSEEFDDARPRRWPVVIAALGRR